MNYIPDATAKQKLVIARMAMALGDRQGLEYLSMSKGEAGVLIRKLSAQLKARRQYAGKVNRR